VLYAPSSVVYLHVHRLGVTVQMYRAFYTHVPCYQFRTDMLTVWHRRLWSISSGHSCSVCSRSGAGVEDSVGSTGAVHLSLHPRMDGQLQDCTWGTWYQVQVR
jgi:hypothetical protein